MTAALKLHGTAYGPTGRRHDPQARRALRFHGREDEPESFALTQFREGALMLLEDCRRWRVENGYSALLNLVVEAAYERIEQCNGHQKTRLVLQLMHLLRLVSLVEISELELATAELHGEASTLLGQCAFGERPVTTGIATEPRTSKTSKREANPSVAAGRIQTLIFKKLKAFALECEVMARSH